jgi:hypothetical protein
MLPRSEADTVVWTEEMSTAFGVALPLLQQGDAVAARMAFKETYAKLTTLAREAGTPVRWTPTLGHDKAGRAGPIEDAVAKGRLTSAQASVLLPSPNRDQANASFASLAGPVSPVPAKVKDQLRSLRAKLTLVPGSHSDTERTRAR